MQIVIPADSALYQLFAALSAEKRIILIAGLPGVGKSLYVQQMALMAHAAGRVVHLLQWDVARVAFETPELLAKYPEIDGVTQPIIRMAVGLWSRQAVAEWDRKHPQQQHVLIGEVPLVGNRLIELVQQHDDSAETLLASAATHFVLPVPSRQIRAIIEDARAKSIANPRHHKEEKDAPPNVLELNWQEAHRLYERLYPDARLSPSDVRGIAEYDPHVYKTVFKHLLRYRHLSTLDIDRLMSPSGSVYDLDVVASELRANSAEVARIISHLETNFTQEQIEQSVANWHMIAKDNI